MYCSGSAACPAEPRVNLSAGAVFIALPEGHDSCSNERGHKVPPKTKNPLDGTKREERGLSS